MMDKKILRQAAAEADSALMKGLPGAADCPADFSPEFEQKLARRLAVESRAEKRNIHRTAGFILPLILAVAMVLGTLPLSVFAATVVGWLRESYGTVSMYLFQEKAPGGELGKYRLSEVPEGYTLRKEKQDEDEYSIIYENEDGLFFSFSYMIQPENGGSAFVIEQMDHLSVHEVVVQETVGDFYMCEDGTTSNSVIWVNEESGILFHLAGWFPEQELIDLVNCINLVK